MLALSWRAIVLVGAAFAAGCTMPRSQSPTVVLRDGDGSIWIRTEEISRFTCENGVLLCDDAMGRLTRRRCRCTPVSPL